MTDVPNSGTAAAAAALTDTNTTPTINTPAAAMQAVAAARAGSNDRHIVRWFVIGWIAAGALMLLLIARTDIQRTQEARVLGTAREMLERGGGVRDLLVPHLNGKPRLQKPPLAYWLTAASFAVFGVNDFSGRLPAALATWLTVGVTFLITRRQFGARAAAFAAAALFGSVLFVRFGALAETDVWTALFATVAIGALLRLFEEASAAAAAGRPLRLTARFAGWAHLSAVAIALLALVKGAPAVYPIIFLLAACAVRRQWNVLVRWLISGAPVTLIALAAPWFIYVSTVPESAILLEELRVIAKGRGHRGWFFVYFGDLLVGTAPWTGLMLLGVADAVRRARRDPRLALLLIWFLAIFVPLCISQQKQNHYLMPAMPPLAILTGWLLDRAVRLTRAEDDLETDDLTADPFVRAARPMLIATLCITVAAIVGLPMAGLYLRHRFEPLHDLPLAIGISVAGAFALWMMNRRGLRAGAAMLAFLACPITLLTLLYWSPTTHLQTYRDVAAAMLRDERDAGGGATFRYGFYAQSENLPLCWAIRRVIPSFFTQPEIDAALAVEPKPVLLTSSPRLSAPIPAGYVERHRFEVGDKPVTIHFPESPPAR